MKKFLGIALVLTMVLTLLPARPGQAAALTDISGHWAEEAINDLVAKGIINGFPDGTFRPDDLVTRAQFAKMTTLALDYQAEAPDDSTFNDVPSNYWGFQPVEICARAGLIVGFPDGSFQPEKSVTKAEAVAILARSRSLFLKDATAISPLADVPDIHWAQPYLNVSYGILFFTPNDPNIVQEGNFFPDQSATRAQAAIFIYRLLNTELKAKEIVVKGSDTLVNLASAWAEEYMLFHPEVQITVSGGGSGIGIAALIDGTTDICDNSRPWKDEEITQAKDKGVNPVQTVVAMDGVSVIVNPGNTVKELTVEQLSLIFQGSITNWKEVGGPDAPISVLSRDSNSGTHVFFKEHIVQATDKKAEYGKDVQFLPTNQAIVDEVARNTNAIGYCGLGYVNDQVRPLGVKKTAEDQAILPSKETVKDGSYPVARPLFCTTDGEPNDGIRAYFEWIMGPAGQKIVDELDFVSL